MRVGFSILSHQTPGPLFKSLISRLEEFPDKEIAIHHDFNQATFDQNIASSPNVELVKNYVRTYWSHTNNIAAIMETFRILYSKDCDWYITLSTNCYPVKSFQHIIAFLENTEFDGFIERNNVMTDYFDFYKYFRKGFQTRYFFEIPFISKKGNFYKRAIRIKRSKKDIIFDQSFIPYHGSDWFIINKKSIGYLLMNQSKINDLVNFLIDVNKGPDINVCPAEIVFQSILANASNFKFSNNYFRFIDWENSQDWHPNTISMRHWESIKESDALFARKFDWGQSKEVIDLINKEIIEK
jgi:hypothetical protein